jgi:hypothetical protein
MEPEGLTYVGFILQKSEVGRLDICSFDSISSRKKCITIGLLLYISLYVVICCFHGNVLPSINKQFKCIFGIQIGTGYISSQS